MRRLGLIGHPLGHSFSPRYFEEKWFREGIHGYRYDLFELEELPNDILSWWKEQSDLIGVNVTIPYKTEVLKSISEEDRSEQVRSIGAANTLVLDETDGKIKAENTDWSGFLEVLDEEQVLSAGRPALVLGNGGAARAIRYALEQIGVDYGVAHRAAGPNLIAYEDLAGQMETYGLIVNTTPLGTYPNEGEYPPIPYEEIGPQHYFFDLVYRPEKTAAMKMCALRGAFVQNGYGMLAAQAENAWDFWGNYYQ